MIECLSFCLIIVYITKAIYLFYKYLYAFQDIHYDMHLKIVCLLFHSVKIFNQKINVCELKG